MTGFTVHHAYSSFRDGQRFGPWTAGDRIELDPVDAAWVNRDSPGCLTPDKVAPAQDPPAEAAAEPADPADRQKPATRDRQHRGSTNRSA